MSTGAQAYKCMLANPFQTRLNTNKRACVCLYSTVRAKHWKNATALADSPTGVHLHTSCAVQKQLGDPPRHQPSVHSSLGITSS